MIRHPHVIVAVRGGQDAKHRCAGLLPLADRIELTALMLQDLLDALAEAESVGGLWVVMWTSELAPIVEAVGARVIRQSPPSGLNESFSQAMAAIRASEGDVALALLPGDLPLMTGAQFDAAAALLDTHDTVLAPSRAGGTGGLLVNAGFDFAPAFGADSARRHIEAARAAGFDVAAFDSPGFWCDIDLPADVIELANSPSVTRTARFLRERVG